VFLLLAASGGKLWPLSLALLLVAWARLQLQATPSGRCWEGSCWGGVSAGLAAQPVPGVVTPVPAGQSVRRLHRRSGMLRMANMMQRQNHGV